jgi:hypothetical protein
VIQQFDGSIGGDDRLSELAAILAAGISRLHVAQRRAESATSGTLCHISAESPPILANLIAIPLERSRATGVTVDRAVNWDETVDLDADLADPAQEFSTWL